MAEKERWQAAQTHEQEWWQKHIETLQLEFYRNYAEDLTNNLDGIFTISSETRILEIGSGAAGILTFLDSEHRYAIEPLENFFAGLPKFRDFRDPKVKYHQGQGEDLPFADDMFDLVIIDNVIDHCQDIEKVLAEIKRTLKTNGILYLRVSTYHGWGKLVRYLLELFQIDKGHPYTLSKTDLENYFRQYDFRILKKKQRGYMDTWLGQIKSGEPKELAKAASLATADKSMYVLRNG